MNRWTFLVMIVLAALLVGCGDHESHAGEGGHDGRAHEAETAETDHGDHDHGDGAEKHKNEDEHQDHGHDDGSASGKHSGNEAHAGHKEGEGHEDHGTGSESHAENGDHGGHADSGNRLALSDQVIQEFGLEVRRAGPGTLAETRSFPGEIVFDEDLMTHVTARVPGRAETILKESGERVEKGDVLAVLSSRELARVRSDYLAAQAKLELAQATYERKRRLAEDQVASQAELQEARQALSDAQVRVELARRELQTLGMTSESIKELDLKSSDSLARYELTAPAEGIIIKRHLTRGERVNVDTGDAPFVIASRERVWAHLSIFPQSIDDVQTGQKVTVHADDADVTASAPITYITPLMHEATRSARARVVLENPSGQWYPGQFVRGEVVIDSVDAAVVLPATAIQTMDGQPTVFVRTKDGFESRSVKTGREANGRVAIHEGLKAGERYAARNTFTLKAEFGRDKLKHAGHSH